MAQVTGDYRSKASGNWNNVNIWQTFNGSTWMNATSYPGQNSNVSSVTIGGNNTVSLNTNIISYTIDRLIIGDQTGGNDTLLFSDNSDWEVNIMLVAIQSDGIISWQGNTALKLPEEAIIYNNGGKIEAKCSEAKRILLGDRAFSSCKGNKGEYSFDELEAALPPPSSNGNIAECADKTIQTLNANDTAIPPSGAHIVWYKATSGGSPVSPPTLSSVGTETYYGESIDNADPNRKSLFRTAVKLTILPRPTISVTSSPRCVFKLFPFTTTYTLEVTVGSGTVTSSAGSVANTSGNRWEVTNVPSGTNIVVKVTDGNGCSESIPITAPDCTCVVNSPTSGGNKTYCSGDTVPNITASVVVGQTVDWYDAASGGTLLLMGNTTYTPLGPGTFYAEARNARNCTSSARTAIKVAQNTPSTAVIGPNQSVFTGGNAIFTVTTTNADSYQWQVSTDGGIVFNNITDGAEYAGTQSTALTVKSIGLVKNGYRYRVLSSKSGSTCTAINSASALLTVKVKTIITNRRITYRVNKD
ncbi:Ig-like domain-containing protein [Arenibacter certesii]|uniref:Ig-like domain-containing protein n=1 Tax=Arenibacter certesii TaxID=228955 RepID=A0A918MHK8_9FLAO|nr:hypothetical protein [Arenibacter certesii]GGW22706.1 hypothetical protein GCM10007383_03080 [Arenibacter certesii]